jgi:hypothetical protein
MAKLTLTMDFVLKNENRTGGNALLAEDPQPVGDGKSQTRKTINFQSTDGADLDFFKRGDLYTVTIEKIERSKVGISKTKGGL